MDPDLRRSGAATAIKTILLALVYVVFFPVLYNTLLGVRTAPQILVNATALARRATAGRCCATSILPSALPSIITGLRVGAGFAFRGLIFAEIIAAKTGIGYLIFEGTQTQQTARTIVGMIVMGLLWLAIDQSTCKPLERATVERWGSDRRRGAARSERGRDASATCCSAALPFIAVAGRVVAAAAPRQLPGLHAAADRRCRRIRA